MNLLGILHPHQRLCCNILLIPISLAVLHVVISSALMSLMATEIISGAVFPLNVLGTLKCCAIKKFWD